MTKKTFIAAVAVFTAACVFGATEWRGAGEDDRIGGRMISPGYLKGKVVMVDCRDYGAKQNAEAIARLQAIWSSYKTKNFILIGSHRGKGSNAKTSAALEKLGVTFPVYRDFGCDRHEPKREGADWSGAFIYIIDETGRRFYAGRDDRAATGVVASAIMNAANPPTIAEWKRYLAWEVANTPGNALLRLKEFAAQHPVEAKAYFGDDMKRLSADADVKKLAKLVAAAKLVKDRDTASAAGKRVTKSKIKELVKQYEDLKESSSPEIVQEAKNALAELKWAAATLSK